MTTLVVRCPKCATAFRVVADQLRVRDGLVRCGVCQTVFDGRAASQAADEPSSLSAQTADESSRFDDHTATEASRFSAQADDSTRLAAHAAPDSAGFSARASNPSSRRSTESSEEITGFSAQKDARPLSTPVTPDPPFVGTKAGPDRPASLWSTQAAHAPQSSEPTPSVLSGQRPAAPPAGSPRRAVPPLRRRALQPRVEPSLGDTHEHDVDTAAYSHGAAPDKGSDAIARAYDDAGSDATARAYDDAGSDATTRAYDDVGSDAIARAYDDAGSDAAAHAYDDVDSGASASTDSSAPAHTYTHPQVDADADSDVDSGFAEQVESDSAGAMGGQGTERSRSRRRRSRRTSSHEPYAEARYTEPRYRDQRYISAAHDDNAFAAERPIGTAAVSTWRRRRKSGPMQVVWRAGVLVGLLALLFQLVWWWRTPIATYVPMARPALEAMCRAAGCTVGYVRAPQYLTIESSSVQPAAPGAGQNRTERFMLEAVLRNRAPHPQPWPVLELSFTDHSDTVVVRRGLQPNDYLPADALAGPFPANTERRVAVDLESQQGVPVSGYRLSVYFP